MGIFDRWMYFFFKIRCIELLLLKCIKVQLFFLLFKRYNILIVICLLGVDNFFLIGVIFVFGIMINVLLE